MKNSKTADDKGKSKMMMFLCRVDIFMLKMSLIMARQQCTNNFGLSDIFKENIRELLRLHISSRNLKTTTSSRL